MKLIVGLGNPGNQYQKTRHNIGFRICDTLAERLGTSFSSSQFKGETAQGRLGSEKIILLKPQTFMNLSGESVGPCAQFYKMNLSDIICVYDDLDLPFAKLRLARSGSAGGHNGIKSLIQHLGTKDFHRLRFGIGRPEGPMKPVDYVLQKFSSSEEKELENQLILSVEAIEYWMENGISAAMNQYN